MTIRCSNPLPHPGPHPFNTNGAEMECEGVHGELAAEGDLKKQYEQRHASNRLLITAQACRNAAEDMVLLGLPRADIMTVEHAAGVLEAHTQKFKAAKGKIV